MRATARRARARRAARPWTATRPPAPSARAPWRRPGRSRPARRLLGRASGGRAAVRAAPQAHVSPEVATRRRQAHDVRALAGQRGARSRREGPSGGVRPADAQVAAAVDGPALVVGQAVGDRSAARPLPVPPVSSRTPGGRRIVLRSWSTATRASGRSDAKRGRARAARRRARRRAELGAAPAAVVARRLQRREERRVDQPAGARGGPSARPGRPRRSSPTRAPPAAGRG